VITNVHSPEVQQLIELNEIAETLAETGGLFCGVGVVVGQVIVVGTGGLIIAGGSVYHAATLYSFQNLVKDGAAWDFKDEIGLKLGPGVTLCTSVECYRDIEYSVPGNIHFAYIGAAAGIFDIEIQAGAAFAEITDPAHDPTSESYVGPWEGEIDLSPFWDPGAWNFGDEATDHEAVSFGLQLWDKYGSTMTKGQFQSELSMYIGQFSRHDPLPYSVDWEVSRYWPYPVGHFNNQGRTYIPPLEQP
jgi:hypothetical protein